VIDFESIGIGESIHLPGSVWESGPQKQFQAAQEWVQSHPEVQFEVQNEWVMNPRRGVQEMQFHLKRIR
jgi:hypothetical protein